MRRAITGGRKSTTILLPNSVIEAIEAKRKARFEETGRYVSTGEIAREYLGFGLKWKDRLEEMWSHT
jgi:hypothetical protein